MASNLDFVKHILEALDENLKITYKKMFGEYGVYSRGKIVALICDDSLFVKPTEAGNKLLANPRMEPPYPGAKPYFLIVDKLENGEFISKLLRVTEADLPPPKVKKKRTSKKS